MYRVTFNFNAPEPQMLQRDLADVVYKGPIRLKASIDLGFHFSHENDRQRLRCQYRAILSMVSGRSS